MKCIRLQLIGLLLVLGIRATAASANFCFTTSGQTVGDGNFFAIYDAGNALVAWSGYNNADGWTYTVTAGATYTVNFKGCHACGTASLPVTAAVSGQFGLGSGVITFTGGACGATPQRYTWNHTLQNGSPFVQRYRWRPKAADEWQTVTLQPGQSWNLAVESDQTFTPEVQLDTVLPDGLGSAWVANPGLPNVGQSNQPNGWTGSQSATTSNGNIWDTQTSTGTLGTQAPITAAAETRNDTTASTGDTLQRQKEANDEKRHLELKSLLIAQDNAQAKRDTVALDAFNQGLNRLNATTASGSANVAGAVNSLTALLGSGAEGTGPGIAGSDLGSYSAGTYNGTAESWLPALTVPTAAPPKVTLPFSALNAALEDVDFDFADEHLAGWAGTLRAVLLVGVTVSFLFASLRLIGRLGNV